MTEQPGVWKAHASQWDRVGPPLRPGAEDGELLMKGLPTPLESVLVLGVTPEMARLAWPAGTRLLAIDRAPAMIEQVWPGFPEPGQGAMLADWLTVDLAAGSRDAVVTDGCFGVTSWPDEHRRILQQVRRFLRPGGRFCFRVFVRPGSEAVDDVVQRALDGGFTSFHAFKLCLLMAAQPDTATGVVTGQVWELWAEAVPDPAAFARRTGWPLEQVLTIDAYRGQSTPYCFPLLAELTDLLEQEGFVLERTSVPSYPLGERCPTLITSVP